MNCRYLPGPDVQDVADLSVFAVVVQVLYLVLCDSLLSGGTNLRGRLDVGMGRPGCHAAHTRQLQDGSLMGAALDFQRYHLQHKEHKESELTAIS